MTRGNLRRRVRAIRKPVAVPVIEVTREQVIRRRPEFVAVVRRTAWKNSGLEVVRDGDRVETKQKEKTYTLNSVALAKKEAMWLEKMRFMCGEWRTKWIGMMGLIARLSTYRKRGKKTEKMVKEARTKGCVPTECQSPDCER